MNTDTEALNPTTRVSIDHGIIGTKTLRTSEYIFNPIDYQAGFTVNHNETTLETPVETSFINLKSFIETPKNNRHKTGFRKNRNDFNNDKRKSFMENI